MSSTSLHMYAIHTSNQQQLLRSHHLQELGFRRQHYTYDQWNLWCLAGRCCLGVHSVHRYVIYRPQIIKLTTSRQDWSKKAIDHWTHSHVCLPRLAGWYRVSIRQPRIQEPRCRYRWTRLYFPLLWRLFRIFWPGVLDLPVRNLPHESTSSWYSRIHRGQLAQ